MQSLFAFYQAKEANFLLAEDWVRAKLQPNLNLDIPEDRVEMAEKEKKGMEILLACKKSRNFDPEVTEDDRIDKSVQDAIDQYEIAMQKDKLAVRSRMLLETEELYRNYLKLIAFLLELQRRNENTRFGENKVLAILADNEKLQQALLKNSVSWSSEPELMKTLNREVVNNNEAFKAYQTTSETDVEEDRDILSKLIKEVVFEEEMLAEYLESKDLYWIENKSILKSMLKKTIKDAESGELLRISQNWEDDKAFFEQLFDATLKEDEWLDDLIEKYAKNWEKDRLALTDVIILKMGVAEMMHFPSVPIKVSINEYIEISKSYSTPKSKQFVNGMLDKLAEDLMKEGKILKSGRGLIDNK